MSGLDRRLNAFRDDLADAALRDTVSAHRYVEGTLGRIGRSVVPVRPSPDPTRARDTEFLFGEAITLFEETGGWAWVQSRRDGYVGYVDADAVLGDAPAPTHRVSAMRTHAYPASWTASPAGAGSPTAHGSPRTTSLRWKAMARIRRRRPFGSWRSPTFGAAGPARVWIVRR